MTLDDIFKVNTNPLGRGGAPTYDLNTALGQQLLGMTLSAGGAGQMGTGVQAFLGNRYNPNYARTSLSPESGGNEANNIGQNYNSLFNLGDALGYGGNRGAMQDIANQNQNTGQRLPAIDPYSGRPIQDNGAAARRADDNYSRYYGGLQDYLKDYVNIEGMSSGWDGSSNSPRSASSTLYRNDNNVLNPVGLPQGYTAREKGNWFQENPEFMSILSVMLPAFGGWAGLAGQAAGTASMGAGTTGLGSIGTAAANAAGSTAMGAASGGTKGALAGLAGSLGGFAGSQAAGSLGGSGWSAAGGQLGSQVGKSLVDMYVPSSGGVNPGTGLGGMQMPGQYQYQGGGQFLDTGFANNPMNRF